MAATALNRKSIQAYHEDGYLIVKGVFSGQEVEMLKSEAVNICKGLNGPVEGLLPHASKMSTTEALEQYAAIHFPHKVSPVMKKAAADERISNILRALVSRNVKCVQTMLFMKAPGKKGQSWHQDEYFIPTRDRSLTGAWVAMDRADIENGCLWVIPGSHSDGVIRRRVANDNEAYADVDVASIDPYTEADFVPVEVQTGDVVFFHGYLLHSSLRNKSTDRFRRALVCHYTSAETMIPWDQGGKLAPTDDLRDIFMVTGEDPYAYKGVTDLSRPFVRPGEGLASNTEEERQRLKKLREQAGT